MDRAPDPLPSLHDDRSLASLASASERPLVVASHFGGWAEPWHALEEQDWAVLRGALGRRVELVRIDSGSCREFARRHGLEVLPAVLILVGGRCVARRNGRVGAARVLEDLENLWRQQQAVAEAQREWIAAEGHPERPSAVRSILRGRHPGRVEEDSALLAHAS